MRKTLDNIEIVEPPIGEISKKRSGVKATCFTSCLLLIIGIITVIIGLRFYIGPGPKTLKSMPENFPKDIPIYDKDAIETITFISGKYKDRGIEIAAFFPKIILSPLLLKAEPGTEQKDNAGLSRDLWTIITTPVGDHRDTIQIEWRNLSAEPDFIVAYYKKELQKKDYIIAVESEGTGVKQFTFTKADGISGSFYATAGQNGTDYATLTVNLSPAK